MTQAQEVMALRLTVNALSAASTAEEKEAIRREAANKFGPVMENWEERLEAATEALKEGRGIPGGGGMVTKMHETLRRR